VFAKALKEKGWKKPNPASIAVTRKRNEKEQKNLRALLESNNDKIT